MKKIALILVILSVFAVASISQIYNVSHSNGNARNCDAALDKYGNMHIVWQDDRDGKYAIYYKNMENNISIKVSNSSGDAINPAIAVDGNIVHIVWQDDRDGVWKIYYKRLSLGGVSLTDDIPISINESFTPTITANNGSVFIAWAENDGGENHIHYTTLYIYPNNPPVADFTFYPKNAGIGDEIHFNSISYDSDGYIVNYTWNFGDGSIGYGRNVSHVYTSNGTYQINLTITDDGGAVAEARMNITVGGMIYVSPLYNDTISGWGKYHFNTIQAAIDNASKNATIKIYPAIYKENIVINKPLKLIDDPIGPPYVKAVIDANGSIGIRIESSNVIIENCTIYNASVGIFAYNSSFNIHNITIKNSTIFNCTYEDGIGIKFENVNESMIKECIIHNNTHGLEINGSSHNSLSLNFFYGNQIENAGIMNGSCYNNISNNTMDGGKYGILLSQNADYNILTNNTIYKNVGGINGGAGVQLILSRHNVIEDNEMNDSRYGIHLWQSPYNDVIGCDIHNNSYSGIYLAASSNNITGCNIYNNSYGILIENTFGNNISSCYVYNNTHNGIDVGFSRNNTIKNNTLSNNGEWGLRVFKSPNNTFINNVFSSYPTNVTINDYESNFTIKGIKKSPPMPFGVRNISKFLNIATNKWLNITIYYEDENLVYPSIENEMVIWKYNGSGPYNGWYEDGDWYNGRGIDIIHNEIWINITSNGTFAPLQKDGIPPVTILQVSKNYNQYITSKASIWLNATDNENGSGLNATYYRIYNTEWHPNSGEEYCNNSNITSYNGKLWYVYFNSSVKIDSIHLCEGCRHYVEYFSIDNVGNNESIHNQTFYVDNTPPNATIHSIIPYCQDINDTNPLSINGVANDNGDCQSGIKNITLWYRYSYDNVSWIAWQKYSTNDVFAFNFNAPYGYGYYQFSSTATDNVGNTEASLYPESQLCVPLNITYTLHKGWNLITVPIEMNWHAWDLAFYINNQSGSKICTTIVMLDSLKQRHIGWVDVMPDLNNFSIENGRGYWVYIKEEVTLQWYGGIPNFNLTLYKGYNLIGMNKIGDTSYVIHNVKNSTILIAWNETLQHYQTCIKTRWGIKGNFYIPMRKAIYIYCYAPDRWHS